MKISLIYVLLQFAATSYLIFTGSIIPANIFFLLAEIIFVSAGIISMKYHGFRFNILPDPGKNQMLITSGPYKYVRHPMYTSVIFITLIWILNEFSVIRLIVWIILVAVLHFKSEYEEKLLCEHFDEYRNYKLQTYKLIPYVF